MGRSETTDRHANARDRKRANRDKHIVSNRSIFTIQDIKVKKGREAAERLNQKRGQK